MAGVGTVHGRRMWVGTLGMVLGALLAACGGSAGNGATVDASPEPGGAAALPEPVGKPVVYQAFARLFGNTVTTNRPWGTAEENGVGRFADFNDAALAGIRELGTTHLWLTGVPRHALAADYTAHGIPLDDPDVIKGRAGSPYAVTDYFDVNPDLAVDPARRMDEFRELVARTHGHGMRVMIDIVPNHVARGYRSVMAPPNVRDFGADDDTTVEYARDNSFYYVPGRAFEVPAWPEGYLPLGGDVHPMVDGRFDEDPAKWTGNGARGHRPDFDDWYETVKVNFGVRPDGTYDFDRLPPGLAGQDAAAHRAFWADRDVPASWVKFRQIVDFWLDQGVDGFRYDMAEMVPVEFWSYLNSHIKQRRPDAFLLAEIYNPDEYRNYLQLGLMDSLYDKVDVYDGLKRVMQGRAPASSLLPMREALADIEPQLLRFLENHDEQRIASPDFAGDAAMGRPGMLVTVALGRSASLLYFGQEVGEPGEGDAGFGRATRTTIFDYWGVPAHQRWMNGGRFDGGQLSEAERALRDFHLRLLRFSAEQPALRGGFADLHLHNLAHTAGYDERLFAFARWHDGQRVIAVANFSPDTDYRLDLALPPELVQAWSLAEGRHAVVEHLGSGIETALQVDASGARLPLVLPPMSGLLLEIQP